jgi:raffinose/stachyose/melibiose transport system permease protein
MRKQSIARGIVWLFIVIGLLITLFPFAWVVSLSIRTEKEVFTSILFPEHIRLRNYIDAWVKFDFTMLFKNSIIITFTSVLVTVFVAALAGYGFAKFRLRASNFLFHLILSGIMVPPIAIVISLFVFMRRLGLFNSYASIIFPYIAFGLPIATLIFKTYIQNLDNDILDAARIDGCGEFLIFIRILLPIIKPAVATVTIFTFMAVFIGQYSDPWQLIGAGVVITILPVLIVFFVLQNQFIRGLTAGAFK